MLKKHTRFIAVAGLAAEVRKHAHTGSLAPVP